MKKGHGVLALAFALVWHVFGPALHDDDTIITTLPAHEADDLLPPSSSSLSSPPSAVIFSSVPDAGMAIDVLAFFLANLALIVLLLLVVLCGRNVGFLPALRDLGNTAVRATTLLLSRASTLNMALGWWIPGPVRDIYDLSLNIHQLSDALPADLFGLAGPTSSPLHVELVKLGLSCLIAVSVMLGVGSWHASKGIRQDLREYVNLYRRYDVVACLLREARLARAHALKVIDTTTAQVMDLRTRWEDVVAESKRLELELATSYASQAKLEAAATTERSKLTNKLHARSERLQQVNELRERETWSFARRIKEMSARHASDAEVKRSDFLEHQLHHYKSKFERVQAKLVDLSIRLDKMKNGRGAAQTTASLAREKKEMGSTIEANTTEHVRLTGLLVAEQSKTRALEQQLLQRPQQPTTSPQQPVTSEEVAPTALTAAHVTIARKQADIEHFEAINEMLSEERVEQDDKIEALEADITKRTDEKTSLEAQLLQRTQLSTASVKATQTALMTANATIARKYADIKSLEATIAAQAEEIEALEGDITQLAGEKTSLADQLQQVRSTAVAQRSLQEQASTDRNRHITELEDELAAVMPQREKADESRDLACERMDAMKAAKDAAVREAERLVDLVDECKRDRDQQRKDKNGLDWQNQQLKKNIQRLELQIKPLEAQVESLEEQLNAQLFGWDAPNDDHATNDEEPGNSNMPDPMSGPSTNAEKATYGS